MKKQSLLLAAAILTGTVLAAPKAPEVKVRAGRDSAVYKVGENIEFVVTGSIENISYTVNDGKTETVSAKLTSPLISVNIASPVEASQ